jgi:DNA-binding NarL/FixJ family response regulator
MRQKAVAELLEISERTVEEHLKLAVRELREGLTQYFTEHRIDNKRVYLRVLRAALVIVMV